MWPSPPVAEYLPATFRKGAVSSARFTADGQSIVYSASWEGQPYGAFLGRPPNPDARDLQFERCADHVDFPGGRHGRAVRSPEHHSHLRRANARANSDGGWGTRRHAHWGGRPRLDSWN